MVRRAKYVGKEKWFGGSLREVSKDAKEDHDIYLGKSSKEKKRVNTVRTLFKQGVMGLVDWQEVCLL